MSASTPVKSDPSHVSKLVEQMESLSLNSNNTNPEVEATAEKVAKQSQAIKVESPLTQRSRKQLSQLDAYGIKVAT